MQKLDTLSEQQFKAILNSAKFSIITTDTNGLITSFNKEAETILEYSAKELVGIQSPAIFHDLKEIEEESNRLSKEYKTKIDGFETFVFLSRQNIFYEKEWTYISKSGKKHTVLLNITALRDDENNIIGFMGIGKNISQIKQNDKILKEKEEIISKNIKLNEFLLDSAGLGSWQWNLKTNDVIFDEKWCSMLGLNFLEIEHNLDTWKNLVHPDDIEKCYEDIGQYLSGESKKYQNVHRLKHSDGTYRYILDQGLVFSYDEKGNPEIFCGTHLDITPIKELENNLRTCQEVAKIGNWSYDVKNNLITWSAEMFKIFDENPKLGTPSYERHYNSIIPEDRDNWQNTVSQCIKNGGSYKITFRTITSIGLKTVEAYGKSILNDKNEVVGLFGTCQDITERVNAEHELQIQKNKAIQASKLASLGEMAAGIAHEVNNPLGVIHGMIFLLKKEIENENLIKRISTIEKSVDRISKIILGLKKLSRTSNTTQKSPVDLYKILEESIDLCNMKATRLNVSVSIEGIQNIFVNANDVELEQVVINLINNSIDAVSPLEQKWIKINTIENNDEAIIRIMDSGKISPKVASKIFEPFFTTKKVGEGTGLGLSISKGIIEEHNGKIVLNENFETTCFEIRLPLIKEKNEPAN